MEGKDIATMQIEWYHLTLQILAQRLSDENNMELSTEDIGKAISQIEGFSQNLQVYWYTLENGLSIYDKLKDYPFPKEIGEVSLIDEDCIYPEGIPRNLYEKQIKIQGQKWTIHANDLDPFPSNPHAHNYELGLKLDLSNGFLYKKCKYISSIGKKKLLQIRNECEKQKITLPTLNINSNE